MPPGSFINAADYATVDELVAHLRRLDADPEAFAALFAWRRLSFDAYPPLFRNELLRWIAVAHEFGDGEDFQAVASGCVRCAMCYAITDWHASRGGDAGFAAPPRWIPQFRGNCAGPWTPAGGPALLPGEARGGPHPTAKDFWRAAGWPYPLALLREGMA